MAYYIGTKTQCEEYNNKVTKGEGYSGITTVWSKPEKHPTQSIFKIAAHEKYSSEMTYKEVLADSWNQDITI